MMIDFVGNMINIGDGVVYVATGKCGFMEKTTVIGFTEKKVRLESKRTVSADHIIVYKHVLGSLNYDELMDVGVSQESQNALQVQKNNQSAV